jgi:ribonucleoside-diphosphate reductase alpha chain
MLEKIEAAAAVRLRHQVRLQPVDPWARLLHRDVLGIPDGEAERSDLRHAPEACSASPRPQIDAANDHVCGTMTLEGAPHLKPEHYAVFDCANPCGKTGKRFLSVEQPHHHDGRRTVLHLGGDLQDHQHAEQRHHRGNAGGLRAQSMEPRHQGQCALPRRLEAVASLLASALVEDDEEAEEVLLKRLAAGEGRQVIAEKIVEKVIIKEIVRSQPRKTARTPQGLYPEGDCRRPQGLSAHR